MCPAKEVSKLSFRYKDGKTRGWNLGKKTNRRATGCGLIDTSQEVTMEEPFNNRARDIIRGGGVEAFVQKHKTQRFFFFWQEVTATLVCRNS